MQTAQKLGVLVIALGMITAVSLPDRHFDRVVTAGGRFVQGLLGTAMGTVRPNVS